MGADAFFRRIALFQPTSAVQALGIGLICAVSGLALRLLLTPIYGDAWGLTLLIPSVIVAALWGGPISGAAATLFCLIGGWLLTLLAPQLLGLNLSPQAVVPAASFGVVGVFVTVLAASLRRTMRNLDETVAHLTATRSRAGQTEGELQAMVAQAAAGIVRTDLKGRIISANARFCEMLGRPESELVGYLALDFTHPDDKVMSQGLIDSLPSATSAQQIEKRYLRPDGSVTWALLSIRPLKDDAGRPHAFVTVAVDVTELRIADAALRQSEARFRLVADSIPNLAWMAEADGAIYWYNQRWYDYTGTTLEQMQGWGWQAVHDPAHVDRVTETFKRSVETGEPWEELFPLRSATGEWRWFLSRALPIRGEDGGIVQWFGTNTDVTVQRETDAALRESEERFRLMADTAPAPVWMTNVEGEVLFVNRSLVDFYGLTEDKILGHAWRQAVHPDDMAAVNAIQAEARPTYQPYGFEARFQRATGDWRWMRIRVSPRFDSDGAFKGYVGMSFDITETREALDTVAAQERRQSFLLTLSDRLRDLTDSEAVIAEVTQAVGETLGADRVGYGEADDDLERLAVRAAWTRTRELSDLTGLWRLNDFGPALATELRQGLPVRISDVRTDPRTRLDAAASEELGTRAQLLAPLMRGGRLSALLFVHTSEVREWTDEEAALLTEVGERAWAEVERTRAQAEVRESEQRFRAIADTAPVLIWVTQRDRQRSFVNQAYVEFIGGNYESARAADWRSVIHPDDQAQLIAESLAGEATEKPFSLEARYLRHDGQYRWMKSFSRPRFGPGGDLIGFVGVAFDVTDIREAAAGLTAIAAERDAILGQLAEGVIVTDPTGAITFVNDAAVRLHGVASLDVTPEAYADTYHLFTEDGEPYPSSELPLARAVLRHETVTDARWRIRRPDETEVVAVGNARPVLGPDGERIGAVLTLRDETARVNAEYALVESEARFRTVADSAPALIWMSDDAFQIIFANHRYKTFFGVTDDDDLSAAWRRMIHPADFEPFEAAFMRAHEARERFEALSRMNHPTLGERWLRAEGVPRFDVAGAFQGYVGASMDVTEAKQAEDDLKRINELLEERVGEALAEKAKAEADLMHAQRMEAVGRLTGGVAHDFNNLLTVVIGALDIILRSDDPAKRKKLGEAALSAARRGEGLTHQLLAFSRRQTLRPQPLDLNALIREGEPLLRRAVGEAVDFRLKLKRGGARVRVDPSQFEAALLNLVVNARDAVGERGEIVITTANCEVESGEVAELAAGDYVCITVCDNGEGMAPHVIDRVFEPFFTTKAVGKGTGLGLSQVYGFARQSGGGVRIYSTVGEGTEIRLYLPPLAAGIDTASDAPAQAVQEAVTGRRILLVEDDPGVAAIATDLLRDLGLEVTMAETGPAALAVLEHEAFELMLTDIVMPGGMTGVDLGHACAELYPAMKIVLTSGYAGDDVDAALADAPWPFLRKPYSGDQLSALIAETLRLTPSA